MQIVFTADNHLFSKVVRFFTRMSWIKTARVSHIALRFGGAEATWMIEATNERGFVPAWWPRFLRDRNVVFKFEVLGCEESILEKSVDEFIDENVFVPYDRLGILGVAIVVARYRLTGKKSVNPFKTKGALTCTEAIYKIFALVKKQTGIEYFKEQDFETIFPEEMLIECESNPEKFKSVSKDY